MDSKEQIIALGQVLKAEQQSDYADSAPGGMAEYLSAWQASANGALAHEPVQQVMALLDGYPEFDHTTRRARVDIAIETLRGLFRKSGDTPTAPPARAAAASVKRAVPTKPLTLSSPVADVPGVGKQNAASFRRLELRKHTQRTRGSEVNPINLNHKS